MSIDEYKNKFLVKDKEFSQVTYLNTVSYSEEDSNHCFEVEDDSFWFEHRKQCILRLVNKYPPINKGPIFDIGGGNGYMTRAFIDSGFEAVLVEPSVSGVQNALEKRHIKNIINSTLEAAELSENSLSAVGAFDVIEHIEDDDNFLDLVQSLLKPDGKLYLTVPAYDWLWSEEDVLAGHYRRYTLKSMKSKLEKNGFKIDYASYFFQILPPLIFLMRTLPSKIFTTRKSDRNKETKKNHKITNSLIKRSLNMLFSRELKCLIAGKKLVFGSSCIICASKK